MVVGYHAFPEGGRAYRWLSPSGMVSLGVLPGDDYSYARAVSPGADAVVGYSENHSINDFKRAFRWTWTAGTHALSSRYFATSEASAVSAHGDVVVGTAWACDGQATAFIWTSEVGMVPLREVASRQGIDVSEWSLRSAVAVSSDGLTVSGNGIHAGQSEGWVIRLARRPAPEDGWLNCTADFNGDGAAGLDDDIESFFQCLGGNCCAGCWINGADFNGDCAAGLDDDIELFFLVLGGAPC